MGRLRTISVAAGAALILEAAVLAVVLWAGNGSVLLPVVGEFAPAAGRASADPTRVLLSQIDIGAAAVLLCLLVALARLLVLAPRYPGWWSRDLANGRHTARWIEFSLTSSITVFLIAQLNGVVDLIALVLVYAATSGMTLFSLLQERVAVRAGHPLLPLCFAAALGIVPWGVIAFTQIGSGLAGSPVAVVVRVVTLVMLAFALAFAIMQWREQSRRVRVAPAGGHEPAAPRADERGERMHVLLSFASTSVFAWMIVLGAVPLLRAST